VYTHYWDDVPDIPEDVWDKITNGVRRLLAKPSTRKLVQFEDDIPRPPQVDSDLIRFNGRGENGHDTFYFTRQVDPNREHAKSGLRSGWFCKTSRKPYDKVVAACLTLIHHYMVEAGLPAPIGSDGSDEPDMWAAPYAMAQEAVGLDVPLHKPFDFG
jgi:hypothetical protein